MQGFVELTIRVEVEYDLSSPLLNPDSSNEDVADAIARECDYNVTMLEDTKVRVIDTELTNSKWIED